MVVSVIDIVEVLTGSERPRKYWSDLKNKLLQEGYDQLSEKIGQLKLQSSNGKSLTTHPPHGEFLLYQAEVGKTRIECRFEQETATRGINVLL